MPEGTVSEQAQGGAGAKALHERFGFDSEDAMAEAFEAMKTDLKRYKTEARGKSDLESKLAALEAERAKREEAELSENQKLSKRLADLEKQMGEREALIRAKDRAILTERVFSAKLAGFSPEESAVLRDLYGAAVAGQEFADEKELAEILKPVETKYEALRARFGATGSGAGVAGGAPGFAAGGAPPPAGQTASAKVKDLQNLSFAEMVARARAGVLGK